jgi:hypothetical protein
LENPSNEGIIEWARKELGGVEPDLNMKDVNRIRNGEIREIILTPRKPGVYDPETGEFIETFDVDIAPTDSFEEIDEKVKIERERREWVDKENREFNKETDSSSCYEWWCHGKRMAEYLNSDPISKSYQWRLLAKRGGKLTHYGRQVHERCYDFYELLNDVNEDHPAFALSWWEIVDLIMGYKKIMGREWRDKPESFTLLVELFSDPSLRDMNQKAVRKLIDLADDYNSEEERMLCVMFRSHISHNEKPPQELIAKIRKRMSA